MAENFDQNTAIQEQLASQAVIAREHVLRWRLIAGAIGLSAVAACGPVQHDSAPITSPSSAISSVYELPMPSNVETAQPTVPPDVVAEVEQAGEGPALPNPAELANGQFVGAIQIFYANNPARATNPNQAAVDQYFKNKGLKQPPANNPAVHRVVASTVDSANNTDVVSDEALAQGFVFDKTSASNVFVVAEHDITPVSAAVTVDGREYKQSAMGINALVMPGDELVLTMPDNGRPGYVNKYIFIADGSFTIQANSQVDINNELFGNPEQGRTLLRLYKCWQPGDNSQRMVDQFHLTLSETVRGDVAAIGAAGPALPDK